MTSILTSVKQTLGIESTVTAFDVEIIQAINSALMMLDQLGIGPEGGFVITSESEVWTDLLGDYTNLEAVKSYIYLRTRLLFDPPTTAHLIDAIERQIKELEWRLTIKREENLIIEEEEAVDE